MVEELTRDEKVAAAVTTGLLRRPAVAAQVSREDRVRAVEELTRDEAVAAEVTTGLLRRPDVAFKAMSDDTARHQVNHAQVERGRQAREHFESTSPVAPAVRRIERTMEFIDLSPPATRSSRPPAALSRACGTVSWARTRRRSCTRTCRG